MSVLQNPSIIHRGAGLAYFVFGRLMIGLAVGLYSSVTPTYISEIVPSNLSGIFGSCHQLFLTFAIVVTSIIGLMLPKVDVHTNPKDIQNSLSWRLAFGAPLIFCALQVLLLATVYTYDSPAYYATSGKFISVLLHLTLIH